MRPEDVDTHRLTVAVDETTRRLLGFYGLVGTTSDDAELSTLFVEPDVIGTGVGTVLFDDAVRAARAWASPASGSRPIPSPPASTSTPGP